MKKETLFKTVLTVLCLTIAAMSAPAPVMAASMTLTYANFGRPFMEAYCTQCHAANLRGEDRQGAPIQALLLA